MGFSSYRCAKSTKGIGFAGQPGGQPTPITVLLPNDIRAKGLHDGYLQLLGPTYEDGWGNPADLSICQDEAGRVDIYALYAHAIGIEAHGDRGNLTETQFEKLMDIVTIVRDDQLETADSFDTIEASELCPYQGVFQEDSDVDLTLEALNQLTEQRAKRSHIIQFGENAEDDTEQPAPR